MSTPPATRPAKCAMSTMNVASISSAISRRMRKLGWRGYAEYPATTTSGRNSRASAHRVVVDLLGDGIDAVAPLVEELARDVGTEPVREVPARVERHARSCAGCSAPAGAPPTPRDRGRSRGSRRATRAVAARPLGEDRPERDEVGVDAGVRLDVRVVGTEQRAWHARRRSTRPGRPLRTPRRSGGRACPRRTCRRTTCPSRAAPRATRSSPAMSFSWRRWLASSSRVAGDAGLDRADDLQGGGVCGGGGLGEGASRELGHAHRLEMRPVRGEDPAGRNAPRPSVGEAERLKYWMRVSPHGIPVCGMGVQPLRLIDMTAVATPLFRVARRHVDLGRTRSAMRWPRRTCRPPSAPNEARGPSD